MQNESQLSKEILDCFVVVNTDQMGNARYDVDFNKLSKEFATARAEGAKAMRDYIILAGVEIDGKDYVPLDGILRRSKVLLQALTTKEHHVS